MASSAEKALHFTTDGLCASPSKLVRRKQIPLDWPSCGTNARSYTGAGMLPGSVMLPLLEMNDETPPHSSFVGDTNARTYTLHRGNFSLPASALLPLVETSEVPHSTFIGDTKAVARRANPGSSSPGSQVVTLDSCSLRGPIPSKTRLKWSSSVEDPWLPDSEFELDQAPPSSWKAAVSPSGPGRAMSAQAHGLAGHSTPISEQARAHLDPLPTGGARLGRLRSASCGQSPLAPQGGFRKPSETGTWPTCSRLTTQCSWGKEDRLDALTENVPQLSWEGIRLKIQGNEGSESERELVGPMPDFLQGELLRRRGTQVQGSVSLRRLLEKEPEDQELASLERKLQVIEAQRQRSAEHCAKFLSTLEKDMVLQKRKEAWGRRTVSAFQLGERRERRAAWSRRTMTEKVKLQASNVPYS